MAPICRNQERPLATAILLLANAAGAPVTWWIVMAMGARGAWPYYFCQGVFVGQCVWLAFWFSLSRQRLVYRAVALLLVLPAMSAVNQYFWSLPPWLWWSIPRQYLDRHFADPVAWTALKTNTGLWLALFLAIYALLLPVRRLRGIALGVRQQQCATSAAKRQFRILDWMVWSAIAGLSLAVLRWTIHDDRFLLYLYFGSVAAVVLLLIGAAFFSASMCGYRSLIAMPLALAFVLGVAWLGTEGAYSLPWFPATGPPIEFRMAFSVVTGSWVAIGTNNLLLYLLGYRLHVASTGAGLAGARAPLVSR